MRLPLRLTFFLGLIIVGNLPATTILTCGFNGGTMSGTGCYSLADFSAFHHSETLDWQTAYGTADAGPTGLGAQYTVTAATPAWMASITGSGLQVGATIVDPTPVGGGNVITRYDNFATGLPGKDTWNNWVGTFATLPGEGAGDHLLAVQNGVLELQFGRNISAALFRISTTTSSDIDATVVAYGVTNPGALDTPLMTYTIHSSSSGIDSGTGGYCAAVQAGSSCNNAPYIGIEGVLGIRSLVISTNNVGGGVLIDSLFLDVPAPEPGTFALTGMVGILAILGRRRLLRGRRT